MARKNAPDVVFSRRLKFAMWMADMTGKQLATKIGVAQPQVSKYATGRGYPKIEHLTAICRVLGVSSDYLLGLSDKMEV